MKTKLFSTLIISLILIYNSCKKEIIPSGKVTKEQKSITDYHSIDVSGAFKVFVSFSATEEKIEVEANENLHKYIIVENISNTLIIKLEDHINVHDDPTLNVYITTKEITGFSASGASQIIMKDTLTANDVNIELSGASKYTGTLNVKDLSTNISGASVIELKGFGDSIDAIASGACEIKAYTFETGYLKVKLSGASIAYFYVTGKLDIEASGASSLYYKGPGLINSQNVSGASIVKKMD